MNKLGLQVPVKFLQAYTLGPQRSKKLLQTDVFFFFRIIGMVHLLLQPVAMPDSRENTLLLKRQLSEINENIWKATPASLLFERHFSFGSSCKHKREELLGLTPQDSSLSHFAGEKHVFQHLSFQCVLPSTS